MKTSKEEVWKRLNCVKRRGVELSPGVYMRDMSDIEAELKQMEAVEVWQKISETEEQRNRREFTEMLESISDDMRRLNLIREKDVNKFKPTI